MKLTIQNFRNIESETIEGAKVHIQWRNWSGKSNILRSVERVLFATINGAKTWIIPIQDGKDSCSVIFEMDGVVYDRDSGNTSAYLDAMWRPIIFCNLLDQEYAYIKKVLSDVVLTADAIKLFGSYRAWSVHTSITQVKRMRTEKNKEYRKIKNRIDFLQQEIENRQHVTNEWLEVYETSLAEKKAKLEKYTAGGVSINDLKVKLDEYKDQLHQKEKVFAEWKIALTRCLSDMTQLMEKWKKLTEWTCPTCWQKFSSKELVDKLRDEYADKKQESNTIQSTLDSVELQIRKINDGIADINNQITKFQIDNQDIIESQTTLEKEIASLRETQVKYAEALKLKNEYDEEMQLLINKLIALQKDEVFIVNEYISPKWKLNQLLQEKIAELLPGCEIVILEDVDLTWEQKSTFKVYQEGIEYRDLSRSQKLYLNIVLSRKLLEIAWHKFPLMIDDAEMFSKTNIDKLKKELDEGGVEYIITKVCNCWLSITTT